ncbi:MAG: flagellar motor protein PomA [Francisellaceae bacterium]|nr:flagellar motor protein PomA [Francisellaceae bacterium]
MDIASLLGLIGSFGIVLAAVLLGSSPEVFVNVPSLLIVTGGTAMVVMMKFTVKQFFRSIKIALKAFFSKSADLTELITTCVNMAESARKGGLLSLENFNTDNEILKKGMQLLVDGHDADVVRSMLHKDIMQTVDRHLKSQKVFKAVADVAPAMGMIGTLIGLVQMLSAMDDPKSIGPSMAVALLTTLYGAIIANMIAFPIADKLGMRSEEETLERSLILDALLSIQSGQNPRVISELLKSYIEAKKRDKVDDSNGENESE